ncbi:hypothetical protein [Trichoplusia ni ascovirus 2c]|uniref:hypothetical protein n=1 Tax=Trichoplusia ni ascovirus 2c TaxID=328615 RepID=UPI0000E44259|nr:hypothetical protein TNAV2c_gp129 [Trichoplusia ni ascovirus 2c]ABF70646.1 hypothetical protein [Trichoplusia ni ascovirus 2c]
MLFLEDIFSNTAVVEHIKGLHNQHKLPLDVEVMVLPYTIITETPLFTYELYTDDRDKEQPWRSVYTDDKTGKKYAIYVLDYIKNPKQIEQILRYHGGSPQLNQYYLERMFMTSCSIDTKTKCTNPKDNNCMLFRSISDDGKRCALLEDKINPITIDTIKKIWCSVNPKSRDCDCISRHVRKNYKKLRPNVSTHANTFISDECWYRPCTDGFEYDAINDEW